MKSFTTALLAIAAGLGIAYCLHIDDAAGREINRVVAQGSVSNSDGISYAEVGRANLTALITRTDPTIQSKDRKSTRLNSSHCALSRMPSSA